MTSAIIVRVRKPLTHFDLILTGQLFTNESPRYQREQTNYRCWFAVHPSPTKIPLKKRILLKLHVDGDLIAYIAQIAECEGVGNHCCLDLVIISDFLKSIIDFKESFLPRWWRFLNPFTAKCGQRHFSTKFPNVVF